MRGLEPPQASARRCLTLVGAGERDPAASARDRLLVAGMLAGSREHFQVFYERYAPLICEFARKRLDDRSEAEDVVQEVFETILRALPSYRGDSSLLVWVFGIARNKVNRRFRRVRRLESIDARRADTLAADAAPADLAVDLRRMLDRCDVVIRTRLTPSQRRVFHLKHLRGRPIRAIAAELGKSEQAVKSDLHRVRRALVEGAPGVAAFLAS